MIQIKNLRELKLVYRYGFLKDINEFGGMIIKVVKVIGEETKRRIKKKKDGNDKFQ